MGDDGSQASDGEGCPRSLLASRGIHGGIIHTSKKEQTSVLSSSNCGFGIFNSLLLRCFNSMGANRNKIGNIELVMLDLRIPASSSSRVTFLNAMRLFHPPLPSLTPSNSPQDRLP